jgi:DNA-binding NtrC family response regulator
LSTPPHILFVEPSADDFEIARWQLERAGIDARGTRVDSAAALRVALSGEASIDLLVVELVVPGFSWQEALAMASALRPHAPCILYSGYPSTIECQRVLDNGWPCVTKDDPDTFITLVKAALAGRLSEAARQTCCSQPAAADPKSRKSGKPH